MPQTVPKRPIKGAVDPTVAKTGLQGFGLFCHCDIHRSFDPRLGTCDQAPVRTVAALPFNHASCKYALNTALGLGAHFFEQFIEGFTRPKQPVKAPRLPTCMAISYDPLNND